jgi:hypothetical protein
MIQPPSLGRSLQILNLGARIIIIQSRVLVKTLQLQLWGETCLPRSTDPASRERSRFQWVIFTEPNWDLEYWVAVLSALSSWVDSWPITCLRVYIKLIAHTSIPEWSTYLCLQPPRLCRARSVVDLKSYSLQLLILSVVPNRQNFREWYLRHREGGHSCHDRKILCLQSHQQEANGREGAYGTFIGRADDKMISCRGQNNFADGNICRFAMRLPS